MAGPGDVKESFKNTRLVLIDWTCYMFYTWGPITNLGIKIKSSGLK
jgi:hypothetical protein